MFAQEREKVLLEALGRKQRLTAREVERIAGVSPATARRLLAALESRGEVLRVHGGVMHPEALHGEPILERRRAEHAPAKRAMATCAASLIRPNSVIYLDAGSSPLALACEVMTRSDLTLVTHSLPVLSLARTGGAKVIAIGGEVRVPSQALIGALALDWLSHLRFDWAFLGASGLDPKRGAGITSLEEAAIKQAAMRQASRSALLADASKWSVAVPIYFAGWQAFDTLITDALPAGKARQAIRAAGLKVVVAPGAPAS